LKSFDERATLLEATQESVTLPSITFGGMKVSMIKLQPNKLCITLVLMLAACAPENAHVTSPSQPAPVEPAHLTPSEWSALSKAGPSHELLEMFVGDWRTDIAFRDSPNGKEQISTGRSQTKWILGRRFVKEEFIGEALGERFQGIGIMGYDNGARHFSNVWVDSMNTAMATASGRYFAEQNRFEFVGEVYDPLQGREKRVRSTIDIRSPNEYTFTMFDSSPTGDEFPSLEIQYHRVPPASG